MRRVQDFTSEQMGSCSFQPLDAAMRPGKGRNNELKNHNSCMLSSFLLARHKKPKQTSKQKNIKCNIKYCKITLYLNNARLDKRPYFFHFIFMVFVMVTTWMIFSCCFNVMLFFIWDERSDFGDETLKLSGQRPLMATVDQQQLSEHLSLWLWR